MSFPSVDMHFRELCTTINRGKGYEHLLYPSPLKPLHPPCSVMSPLHPATPPLLTFWLWTQQQTGLNWLSARSRAGISACGGRGGGGFIFLELQLNAWAVNFMSVCVRSDYWLSHNTTQVLLLLPYVKRARMKPNEWGALCVRMHANSRPEGSQANTMWVTGSIERLKNKSDSYCRGR